MAKKPTGILGYTRVSVHLDGSADLGFHPMPFPKDKESIEVQVVQAFMRDMDRQCSESGSTWSLTDPRQNLQNHFDFTVSLPDGSTAWLELMEWAPLSRGGYAEAAWTHNSYDLAKAIVEKIMTKAAHYGTAKPGAPPLHLLVYITHGAFLPSDMALKMICALLARESHPFVTIYFHYSIDVNFGVVETLAPVDEAFKYEFDPEAFRDHIFHNLNPANAELDVGEGSV